MYESGVIADDEAVAESDDPDLWLLRDDTTKADGTPAHMFWDVVHRESNTIPGPITFRRSDPDFMRTHVTERYPRAGSTPNLIPGIPDRVELRVRLRPMGLEVLRDLVDSGDLDAAFLSELPTFTLVPKRTGDPAPLIDTMPSLVWTLEATEDPQLGRRVDFSGAIGHCVTNAVNPRL